MKPNNSGDGEIAMILFAGAAAGWGGFQAARHLAPDSTALWLLGKLARMAGEPATPQMEAIIAGALAGVCGIAVVMVLMDIAHRGKKKRAALRMMRDARELERIEEKFAAKQGRTGKMDRQTLKAVSENFTRPEQQPGQATPGFIVACAGGFIVAVLIAAHFLL